MSFYPILKQYESFDMDRFLEGVNDKDVRHVLQKTRLTDLDFLILLSGKAEDYLEEMANKAHQLTVQNFGRVIQFYTPMYLSNFCNNQCAYCGFNTTNTIERKQLTLDEVKREAEAISQTGLKHILVLTGDAPQLATVDYISECCNILRDYFSSIAIEIYALTREEYEILEHAGVDALTIYQETYSEELYQTLHPKGPKKDYRFRLDAPERGLQANFRSVGIGALLGLNRWQQDIFLTALHADYLQTAYTEAEISISLPRMRPHEGCFQPAHTISDKSIVQMMTALRLFLPRAGITVSTRESATFRNNILRLGVTRMSAGSCTSVGGHSQISNQTGQFEISDNRTVEEMTVSLKRLGYQPVFKDWQCIL
ncbi:MAG: 2-iminoacetate synthase ThiH [Proteobacteria bacterium]|nr:2-iminoacetate synthase ThiH [Pseudomonadota bacterium]